MKLERLTDAGAFRQRVLPFLAAAPHRHALVLEMTARLEQITQAADPPLLWLVTDGESIAGAALRTSQKHHLLVSEMAANASEIVAAEALRTPGLTGFTGEKTTVNAVVAAWKTRHGRAGFVKMDLGFYELTRAALPRSPSGVMRLASTKDLDTLCSWERAYVIDTRLGDGAHDPRPGRMRLVESNQQFVWDDDGLTSMAHWTVKTEFGAKLTGVYTPPPQRGKGYARALVATLSHRLLGEGYPRVTLFTDLSNPTSNTLYQDIGFKNVALYQQYDLA